METPLHIENEEFSFDFETYKKRYTWVQDMFITEQDNIHHSEGNVGIHTNMVMDAMIALPEFKELSLEEKKILFLGSLFHDVEKRSTTRIEDGRIVSPGHAKKGEVTTRNILYRDFDCNFSLREQICKVVRHHGLPLWIFDKQSPIKSIVDASLNSKNYFLYLIAKADILGRFCLDKEEMLYRIELFKEYANEYDLLYNSKEFFNEHTKAIFFEQDDPYIEYVPFDNTNGEMIMMCGLPGAGKDYFIEKNLNTPVISLDKLRQEYKIKPGDKYGTGFIIQMAKEKARVFLRNKKSFVWNATNLTKQTREQVVGLAREYNFRVKIIYLEVPYKVLKEQNKNREYPIPEKILEKFIDKLELPNLSEAHCVEYYHSSKKQQI